jgi:superfamily II DNA or RNA helicase
MAGENEQTNTIRKLLLAFQFHATHPSEHPKFVDFPQGCTMGFTPTNQSFLTSVSSQVSVKGFITSKQFAVVEKMLVEPSMSAQFGYGADLPELPGDFKWVNFGGDSRPAPVLGADVLAADPDVRDGAVREYQIGGRTLDLTADMSKPWGTLFVEKDELIFRPLRYPTTNIKPAKFRWDGDEKVWRHKGIHAETIQKVIGIFGEVIVDESVDLAIAEQNELIELPEDIATHGTLFDFQKDATQFLLSRKKCLLALAPGLGKTATAITAANKLLQEGTISTIGIIAPKSLLKTWQNEIEKWVEAWSCILHSDFKDQPLDADWLIVNYDALSRGTLPAEMNSVDLVIFDETILLKNHSRKKDRINGKQRWVFKTKRVQAAFEISRGVEWVWMLSGGPTSRYVDDLWAQLYILDPKRFSSYWRFADEYCHVNHNGWAREVTGNKPDAIAQVHEHFGDTIFARSQNQVLDLPEWIFEEVEVPMSRKQEKLYEQMNREWIATLETASGEVKLHAPNTLVQVIRLTQIASNPVLLSKGLTALSPKWNAVQELLEVRPLPAIIWTRFIETAKRMEHHLVRAGYRVATLIGKTPANIRADVVGAFQKGKIDIIIAHPKVGKFGLTLTAARTTIYLENSYDGDDYYQSLHRVRRIGTTHSPLVITLKSIHQDGRPTVDHLIADVLEAKADTTFKITAAKLIACLEGDEGL